MPQCPICHTEYESSQDNNSCSDCGWPFSGTVQQYQEWGEGFFEKFLVIKTKLSLEQESSSGESDDDCEASEEESSEESKDNKKFIEDIFFIFPQIKYLVNHQDKIEYLVNHQDEIDTILKEFPELKNNIEKQRPPLVTNDSLVSDSDLESWDDLGLPPPKTVSTSEPGFAGLDILNKSETSPMSLEPTEQKIITDYNSNPKQFGQSSLEVGITEKTFSNQRLGSQEKITFQPEIRGTYWIFGDSGYFYLLINKTTKINQFNFDYIKEVFDCYNEKENQNYKNFKLVKPAQVSKLNQGGELFQLEQKGTLEFY
ncbi:hypothetical protein PL8927_10004 [Planktothrix serta PCC 8927]|uniref:Uncharacterized protein n=1 Tax=Planktothrix serta PCC 8927 TaxID=671068 RepID=A0A7Z9BEJ3_9CYAN|nr:hypothetical protein [Planktothrix serta]VXD10299.1 hypothetical protein PL8927_10004 [Planktothrix serta PCC 8927]